MTNDRGWRVDRGQGGGGELNGVGCAGKPKEETILELERVLLVQHGAANLKPFVILRSTCTYSKSTPLYLCQLPQTGTMRRSNR